MTDQNTIVPAKYYDRLPANARKIFLRWAPRLYDTVRFNMPDSELHAMEHCERVLFHALAVGAEEIGDDDREALEILAHAAVFHDTRRHDEYLDTGHGARAAVYYEDFCRQSDGTMTFHPESALLMRFHDLDDSKGYAAIDKNFPPEKAPRARKLYEIFKDADALDRWRLGRHGLDEKYLRNPTARSLVGTARDLVTETMDPDVLDYYDRLIDEIMKKNGEI